VNCDSCADLVLALHFCRYSFTERFSTMSSLMGSFFLSACFGFLQWELRLSHNVPAAWRSGGFHCRLCGLLPFNFALPFLRGYCRRCAKPHVVGSRFARLSFINHKSILSKSTDLNFCQLK